MESAAWEARAAALSAESASRDAEFASWAAEEAQRESAEQTRLLRAESNWRQYRETAAGRYVTGWMAWAKTVGSERWPAWRTAHQEWVAALEAGDPTEALTREAQPELERTYPVGTAYMLGVLLLSVASLVGFWILFDDVLIPTNTAGGSGPVGGTIHALVGLVRVALVICCTAAAALVTFYGLAVVGPTDGTLEKRKIRDGIAEVADRYWDDIIRAASGDPRAGVIAWESPDGMSQTELAEAVRRVEGTVVPAREIDVLTLPRVAPQARPAAAWMGAGLNALLQEWGAADRQREPYPRFDG